MHVTPIPSDPSTPYTQQPSNTTHCYDRIHPVQACSLGGIGVNALVTISGIVGGILTPSVNPYLSYALYGMGAISAINLSVTSCSSFFLCSWRPKKTLEQTVDTAVQQVESLKKQLEDLRQKNQELATIANSFRESLQKEKEENTTLTSALEKHSQDVATLTRRAQELQTLLDQTVGLQKSWQAIAQKVAQGSAAFDAEIQRLKPTAQQAEEAVDDLQALAQTATTDLEQARLLAEKMEGARKGWIDILHGLYQDVATLKEDLARGANQLKEQQQLNDTLHQTNEELEGNSSKLASMVQDLQGLITQYTEAENRFTTLKGQLEKLQTIPETASLQEVRKTAEAMLRVLRQ